MPKTNSQDESEALWYTGGSKDQSLGDMVSAEHEPIKGIWGNGVQGSPLARKSGDP